MERSISNENALPQDLFQFIGSYLLSEITMIVKNPNKK